MLIAVIEIVVLVLLFTIAYVVNYKLSKTWMDYEKQLQKEEDSYDERRVQRVRDSDGGGDASGGATSTGASEGSAGTRQESVGHDLAVRDDPGQVGKPLQDPLKEKVRVIKALILHELERLERQRRQPAVVAQYDELRIMDPTLARLLAEVDYAAIGPMRKVLDHLKRREVVRLVRPIVGPPHVLRDKDIAGEGKKND